MTLARGTDNDAAALQPGKLSSYPTSNNTKRNIQVQHRHLHTPRYHSYYPAIPTNTATHHQHDGCARSAALSPSARRRGLLGR